ncbi:MAG: TonB-dependent receptor plug domain-containing protein [Ichthyobacteriaceae bacterium]|nr:TonB-dependent receptor plug domain-containing protein [Ichthyobacteriaceae bacterium]
MKINTLLFIFIFLSNLIYSQNINITGKIVDSNNIGINEATIQIGKYGSVSDKNGNYILTIPYNKKVTITFSHIVYNVLNKVIYVEANKSSVVENVVLKRKSNTIDDIVLIENKDDIKSVKNISAKDVTVISTAGDGITSLLKSLPGVVSNNEMSSQYMVRGGNFDENLIYVNGMEVYKPFLVRSGMQEGLSFVNPHMVENINFYAGGFESKYGDKLSSVLNVDYRKPDEFQLKTEISLLNASATIDLVSDNKKWSSIIGFRYKNISLLSKTQDTETNFKPIYSNFQSIVYYTPNKKLNVSLMANFSLNNYNYQPISRTTNFGTLSRPLKLTVYYDGNEQDNFNTTSVSSNIEYKLNKNTKSSLIFSAYQSDETEYYDILAQYRLSDITESITEEDGYLSGIGSQLEHARNEFSATVFNANFFTKHIFDKSNLEWGVKYSNEKIYDRLNEWEYVDSSGFSIPQNNISVQNQHKKNLDIFRNTDALNTLQSNRVSAYTQYEYKHEIKNIAISYNIGLRVNYWDVNKQTSISPRAIINFQNLNNTDTYYWVSVGKYSQPPFYAELRDLSGNLNKNVKAQDSWHFVSGMDYEFTSNKRPFKFTGEVYYKHMYNLNPYNVDNIKVQYQANNSGIGYIAGADMRINGEFVPGIESWMSVGIMKAEQKIDNKNYIPLPTDQRFKFSMFFQDYVPKFPTFKVNLNMTYSTGMPGGGPNYSNPYDYSIRLPDYKRLDIGFTKIISDHKHGITSKWLPNIKYVAVSVEALNIADIRNTISYSWARDVYSKQIYAVPNKLTGRFLNLKLQLNY